MKVFKQIAQWLTVLGFLGFISFPIINGTMHLVKEFEGNENRAKAEKPEFNINTLDQYTAAYDTYFTDNFSLRQNFIKAYNLWVVNVFQTSPLKEKVTIGKKGWFFHAENIPQFEGEDLFTEEELNFLAKELAYRTAWAKERGIAYYVVPVPSKLHIYPEFLPDYVEKSPRLNTYDQFIALGDTANFNLIDTRKNLRANKGNVLLYQKTDGHWNDLGAYYGYQAIMNALEQHFGEELKPVSLDQFDIVIEEREGALTKMISLESSFPEPFVALKAKFNSPVMEGEKRPYDVPENVPEWDAQTVKTNPQRSLKGLIFRDSYGVHMMPFLSLNFGETIFIHDAWTYKMNEEIVLQVTPDIIINLFYAGNIRNLLENSFRQKETLNARATKH